MKKTEKLGLNLFERTDPVLAESFNENTNLLEAVLNQKATVICDNVEGTTQTLTFDKPVLMLVLCFSGSTSFICKGQNYGMNFRPYLEASSLFTASFRAAWGDEGKTLHLDKSYSDFHYIAFLQD